MKLLPRLAGILALCLALLLIWVLIVAPLAAWKARQIADLQELNADETRLTQALMTLRSEQLVLSGSSEINFVWRSPRIGTATAEVQSALSTLASQSGISLRSITPLPISEGESASTIAFRIESEATLDTLTDFLGKMEYGERALVVRSATLRRLARATNEHPQPVLFFQIDVVAPVVLGGEANP